MEKNIRELFRLEIGLWGKNIDVEVAYEAQPNHRFVRGDCLRQRGFPIDRVCAYELVYPTVGALDPDLGGVRRVPGDNELIPKAIGPPVGVLVEVVENLTVIPRPPNVPYGFVWSVRMVKD
jgi:hypothetical protein